MPKQDISFTELNEQWLEAQVNNKQYKNKSDVINDLIQEAREKELIRKRLVQAEHSGFTNMDRHEILADIKQEAHSDGDI